MGTPLVKITRVWRVETRSDGVGADLLGVQQLLQVGQDVLPRYLGQLLGVVLVAVGQPGQGETAGVHRLLAVFDHSAGEDQKGCPP